MAHENSKGDLLFKKQFESCEFPINQFDHRAHLQLAYVYLTENSVEQSTVLMREALKAYLDFNEIDPGKYHETLTKAWILAVRHFMSQGTNYPSSEELIKRHPQMLDPQIMMTHYSTEVLFSDQARRNYVKGNLEPVPESE